jgi:hypothetical protein
MDYELILRCLNETEQELLRIDAERCEHLRQNNQLTAVLLLLSRCVSLFRSMVEEFRSERLDAFDAVRRAFLETWLLAMQLRMATAAGEAARWLAGAELVVCRHWAARGVCKGPGTWRPKPGKGLRGAEWAGTSDSRRC